MVEHDTTIISNLAYLAAELNKICTAQTTNDKSDKMKPKRKIERNEKKKILNIKNKIEPNLPAEQTRPETLFADAHTPKPNIVQRQNKKE